MTSEDKDPPRWSDLMSADAREARFGEGLRQLRNQTQLSSAANRSYLKMRLRRRLQSGGLGRLRLVLVTIGAALLFGAGVASALVLVRTWRPVETKQARPTPAAPPVTGTSRAHRPPAVAEVRAETVAPAVPAPEDLLPLPPEEPGAKTASSKNRGAVRQRRSLAAAAPAVESLESIQPTVQLEPAELAFSDASHSAEAALLSDAVRALRRLRDPRLALARLDEHAARFTTTGRFAREALLARIEAHLALVQRGEALAILEPLAINTIPRPRPLYLLRGDLRAADGRCQAALADFDAAMNAASDDTAERALRGKAICRSRLGDKLGAKSEVRRHLELFPQHPQGSWLVEKLGPL